MPANRLSLIACIGLLALLGFTSLRSLRPGPDSSSVEGEVRDADGPVQGALVRWKGEREAVRTDAHGRFRLSKRETASARLTGWKDGYYIGGTDAKRQPVAVDLRRLPRADCEAYSWVDPTPTRAAKNNCGNCHGEIYREWSLSGHAHAATNRHFLSLYDGTDWHGKPGIGWSLRDEYPDGVGVCTACHAPTVPDSDPAYFNLSAAQGVARQGVHCDYCHKIADAGLGTIGLTHGRFGLKVLRPAEGQLFFGPLDDVDRGEDAYSPIYKDSRYCASCHEGTVLGVHVYSTYSEWLESPAGKAGKQCQTCHMAPTGRMTNIAPGKGGIWRDPATLGNHRFFAGSQLDMLREAVNVTIMPTRQGADRRIDVELRADAVGHRVPTGFVDRQLILVVEAVDTQETRIAPRSGPVLPPHVGPELAGLPGRLFTRLLTDHEGHAPVPFWRADDRRTEDTRLVPGQTEKVTIVFGADVRRLQVRLLYRRGWDEVARSKAWTDNEMSVFDRSIELDNSISEAR